MKLSGGSQSEEIGHQRIHDFTASVHDDGFIVNKWKRLELPTEPGAVSEFLRPITSSIGT